VTSTYEHLESQAHYRRNAAAFSRRYHSVGFEEVHGFLLQDLPAAGAQVLDVGAGSGRDAAALAARGYLVTAVEPCAALREIGRASAKASNVRWLNDGLPGLERVAALGDRYDFILCSAVLIHVAPDGLAAAFASLAGLLNRRGRLAVTFRSRQAGESPTLFRDHSLRSVRAAAARAGLSVRRRRRSADAIGRPGVIWESWILDQGAV
jgi:2-polyprenyl-3-methyl-5-hydroxy-6-metoxy-1,4-benzoquinol methylase